MPSISTFDSTKEPLHDLLRAIHEGSMQLPEFQRGWVWDDHHIVSLIGSLAQAYPIGAIMVLQTGNPDVNFQTRPVEGVPALAAALTPERLILDGQQRLTSLYQAVYSPQAVLTRDATRKTVKRFYYLDIAAALAPGADLEEAVISVPEHKQVRKFNGVVVADYSTPDLEWQQGVFPLNIIFDVPARNHWMTKYLQAQGPEHIADRLGRWSQFDQLVLQAIQQYNLPVIKLGKESPKAAVCLVFEKVNTGGVPLTVFELLTATFAMDDFNLRQDWTNRQHDLHQYEVLTKLPSDYFLQAISIAVSYQKRQVAVAAAGPAEILPALSAKRKDILSLKLPEYQEWADKIEAGYREAAEFMVSEHIFEHRDLPYVSQLVPLATVLTLLGPLRTHGKVRTRLRQWLWCGILGELYGSATETRFARDVQELMPWLLEVATSGATPTELPLTVQEASFSPERLLRLRSRGSAAYKGLYALMMQKDQALDFRSGGAITVLSYFNKDIDIHHLFPKKWCIANKISETIYDSVINKTPLSAETNRMIGGHAPSAYLQKIEAENGRSVAEQAFILQTHHLVPDLLRADDFSTFYNQRARAILTLIAQAMGKPVELEAGKEILDL